MGRGKGWVGLCCGSAGVAWHSHFGAQKHLSGPPRMLGTGTELLQTRWPGEVGKYHNQINGWSCGGKVPGWLAPPSWESNPLALPSPFPGGPIAILTPQWLLLGRESPPGTWLFLDLVEKPVSGAPTVPG